MGSFPLLRVIGCTTRPLSRASFQDRDFSLFGPATSHSPVASVRCGLVAPSSVLFAPLVSSPCPDANRGIDLLAIESSDLLTL